MAAVYVNNLTVNAGSNFSETFTLEDRGNSYFNLSGCTVSAQMRKWSGSSTAIDFNVTILYPPSDGQILIELDSEQTMDIKPGRYVYDVVVSDEFEYKYRVIEGMVLVREGVTR